MDIAKRAQDSGIRYFMEARYPNQTNEETALELSDILNQTYQSSLYSKKEQFSRNIAYKSNGSYIFLE